MFNKNNIKILYNSIVNLSTNHRILTQSDLSEKIRQKNLIKRPKLSPRHQPSKTFKKNNFNNRLEQLENENIVYEAPGITRPSDEKEFLAQASFKIRNESLDNNARDLIQQMESLTKTSTDPKHLTTVHETLNQKIHDLIDINTRQPCEQDLNVLVELNPGFGLLTKKFLTPSSKFQKFLLLEPFSKFHPFLNEIKTSHPYHDLTIIKSSAYTTKFLYDANQRNLFLNQIKSVRKDVNLTFYGILPWNSKDFMNRLFTSYCSDERFFGLGHEINPPEFYMFIPEVLMAKLSPAYEKKYSKYKTRLSVFSSILTSLKVLTVESVDYFFPYPLMSKLDRHPGLDNKKMFLIHLKFKQNVFKKDQKRLFYLFVTNLYCHRSEAYVKDCLKSVCKDVEFMFDKIGIWKYTKLSQITPYQVMKMFSYLIENDEMNQMKNLLKGDETFNETSRNKELKGLKSVNQSLSGQFILPNKDK